jgi:hypothetical protein
VSELPNPDNSKATLLAALVSACKRRGWDEPTVMMLRVALDMHEIPYEVVSLSELGLEVGTS